MDEYVEFAEQHCCGTQFEIAKYIDKLHKKGFNFKERKVNDLVAINDTHGYGGPKKRTLAHILINKDK